MTVSHQQRIKKSTSPLSAPDNASSDREECLVTEYQMSHSWATKAHDTISCRLWFDGRVSLDELLAKIREEAGSATDVTFGGGMIMWTRPPTEEEIADIRSWEAKQAARLEEWERATLARLSAKYGPGVTS